MAKGFRPVDRDQSFLLPPGMREWLPAGHLAWLVIDAVGALELSRWRVRVTPAGSWAGRAAYDPGMLLALLVYGYARGCGRRGGSSGRAPGMWRSGVICAQDGPDQATIARLRRDCFAGAAAVEGLSGRVLTLAAAAGLGKPGLIAVDGTKIAASAPEGADRAGAGLRALAREILAGAGAVDAAEDEWYGDARGDELPAQLS